MDNVPERPDIKIVGLDSLTNGRSCTCHATCGQYVFVDDILRLVKCVVTVNGVTEEAIKLVKITDAKDSCTVAYVPRVSVNLPKVIQNLNKFAQVVKIYKELTSSAKRRLANQNKGMASIVFLDNIPVDK
jgi:hypothetical protein